MTESMWSQIITALSTLTGILLTLLFTNLQQNREDRRWRYSFFVPKEVEALHELLRTTAVIRHIIARYLFRPLNNEDEFYEKVYIRFQEFETASQVANTYLDPSQIRVIDAADAASLRLVKRIQNQIGWVQDKEAILEECMPELDELEKTLAELINMVRGILRTNRITSSIAPKA